MMNDPREPTAELVEQVRAALRRYSPGRPGDHYLAQLPGWPMPIGVGYVGFGAEYDVPARAAREIAADAIATGYA